MFLDKKKKILYDTLPKMDNCFIIFEQLKASLIRKNIAFLVETKHKWLP